MNREYTGTGLEIAVIGMAARLPGAENVEEFWENLQNGVESIYFLNDEELENAGVNSRTRENPKLVKSGGGILAEVEYFDAAFFNYIPGEAEMMTPTSRIFHEITWTALEDAGYNPRAYTRSIGLYAGVSSSREWEALSRYAAENGEMPGLAGGYLSSGDFTCTLISYKLDLKGPAFTLQTACSTSLVALHLASQGLLAGDCDMAVAGGIRINMIKSRGYIYEEGMINSPDGHCRAFDARANGCVGGEGAGLVVLKRLEDAAAQGDNIYAVIKGSAINNDGIRKVGYAAPSIEGQAGVIVKALQMAEVNPEDITYVETHGTGTALGDLTEIEALKIAFHTTLKHFCAIGSVKTNFGHIDTAAGIAGFIKTVLALRHKQIPPSLNFETANPKIDFENSPFYVNHRLLEWKRDKSPLRAGVSSFGIGGTNAHVVLEEWNPPDESANRETPARENRLLLLSAKTEAALETMTANLAAYLINTPRQNLADVAYTLHVGRERHSCRRKLVCGDVAEAITALTSPDTRNVQTYLGKEESKPIIFIFPGLGPQYVDMGLGLYQSQPVFRKELDHCFALLREIAGIDAKAILYPSAAGREQAENLLRNTTVSQYIVFIFEYALTILLHSWGITPRAMIGYSFGEYAAACLAGVFSLEDALRLLKSRVELIGQLPPGMMLSVPLPAKDLQPLPDDRLDIGIDNGATCVVSGPYEAVKAFEKHLREKRVLCQPLYSTHGIHSRMMDPIEKEFEKRVRTITLDPPRVPYISTLTGNWIKIEDAVSPAYWAKQLTVAVRFAQGIRKLIQEPGSVFLEVGPGRDMTALVNREIENHPHHKAVNLVRHPQKRVEDDRYLAEKIGLLWLYGAAIDGPAYYREEKRTRQSLPTYPFERQRYWKLVEDYQAGRYHRAGETRQTRQSGELSTWFYVPTWKRKENYYPPAEPRTAQGTCLVFCDETGLGHRLIEELKKLQPVITVKPGLRYLKENESEYTVNPKANEDYAALSRELEASGQSPTRILHLWGVTGGQSARGDRGLIEQDLERGYYSLVNLARELGVSRVYHGDVDLYVITDNMREVIGDEPLHPGKAAVLGPCLVITQELPHIVSRSMDISHPGPGGHGNQALIQHLIHDIIHPGEDRFIAYRGTNRWSREFDPVPMIDTGTGTLLRRGGVYLITGGLGNIGGALAEYLIKDMQAKLILTGRTSLPVPEMWNQYLLLNDEKEKVSRDIQNLRRLEELGGEVLYFQADIADRERMRELITEAEARFGKINGVIHAAGIIGEQSLTPIVGITEADSRRQFQAKLYGIMVLEELFREKNLDFCLLLSSIASVLGGLAFTAYSAANNSMDAFADYYNRKNREPWIAVNWDGTNKEETQKAFQLIFTTVLKKQVIFSRGGDLEGRMARWVNIKPGTGQNATGADETHGEKTAPGTARTLYARPALSNPYIPPRNKLERRLAEIWQAFFGIEQIGIEDDLFDLGGDSLKAMNVIAIIQKELNVTIPFKEFFENSTIAGVARCLSATVKEESAAIEPVEKKEYYPLSSAQERLYIYQQMNPASTNYNTVIAEVLEGDIEETRIMEIFKKIIMRHESLRTSIEMIEDRPVQRIHELAALDFSMEYYRQEEGDGASIRTGAAKQINDFVRPFDLSQAPLLRIGLVKTGTKTTTPGSILVVDMHHIVTDAVSHDIFRKELVALSRGEQLPAIRLQYKDYSQWQHNPLYKQKIREQEQYWLESFKGEIPVLNLPYDYPRPALSRGEGEALGFILGKELKGKLERLMKETGTTLFMVLLATYNILLSIYAGQEDIIVGIPITGRNNANLQEIIGFFINMLPMRNFPAANKTFAKFLAEVKTNTLNAFENQDYQFEELVRKLDLHANLNRNPLFDTVFALQNVTTAEIGERGKLNEDLKNNPEINVNSLAFEKKQVKFDLLLRAGETGDTIAMWLEYSTELFKPSTIEQMKEHYLDILEQVLENKDIALENIQVTHDLLATAMGIDNREILSDFEF